MFNNKSNDFSVNSTLKNERNTKHQVLHVYSSFDVRRIWHYISSITVWKLSHYIYT